MRRYVQHLLAFFMKDSLSKKPDPGRLDDLVWLKKQITLLDPVKLSRVPTSKLRNVSLEANHSDIYFLLDSIKKANRLLNAHMGCVGLLENPPKFLDPYSTTTNLEQYLVDYTGRKINTEVLFDTLREQAGSLLDRLIYLSENHTESEVENTVRYTYHLIREIRSIIKKYNGISHITK